MRRTPWVRALSRRGVAVVGIAAASTMSMVCGAVGAVPAGAVGPSEGPTTTTTVPPTTVPPTTLLPAPAPTTPPTVAPTPAKPDDDRNALGPEQTVASEAELATLTDSQRALLRRLQSTKETLAVRRFALVALAREVTVARERLEAARAVEREARARVDETTAQLERLEEEIVRLAAAAYRNHAGTWALGAIGSLDVGNGSALARAQTYARSDVSFLGARVDALTELRRRLESEQRSAESARVAAEASATDLDARLAEQKQAYDDAGDATARAQAAVARGLGSDARLVAQMVDPHFGADDITAALAFVQGGNAEPSTLDAIFALPVPGASLSSPFGLRVDPISGSIGNHGGLDFGADARTPIHAAAAGMVIIAGECGGYGNCVVIDHGTFLGTVYGHMSQVLAQVGDLVAAGDVIGLVGSTGKSTGPHLHFEVRFHGTPIDPVPTLAG